MTWNDLCIAALTATERVSPRGHYFRTAVHRIVLTTTAFRCRRITDQRYGVHCLTYNNINTYLMPVRQRVLAMSVSCHWRKKGRVRGTCVDRNRLFIGCPSEVEGVRKPVHNYRYIACRCQGESAIKLTVICHLFVSFYLSLQICIL